MQFGSHVSIARGIENTPILAEKIGCECFQIFTKPPQGGAISKILPEQIESFRENLKKTKIDNFYIHTAYYINLASSNNRIYFGSIKSIREDLERGDLLGAKYVLTHIGSAKDLGEKESIKKVISAFEKVLDGYNGKTKLLIENSAGAGNIIGDIFEEIATIIKGVGNNNLAGICLDTAHAFESGYDLHDKKSQKKLFNEIEKCIGIDKIKLFHVNDSITKLGSRKDRHANIGKGEIGEKGFWEIIHNKKFKDIDMILETPREGVQEDLKKLKQLKSTRK